MRQAEVYCRGIKAGIISKDEKAGRYAFVYDADYVREKSLPAISLTLPKRTEAYESNVLFPFFFGLLSEGENKEIRCRRMRIDEQDHFKLLLKTCDIETIGGVIVREIT